MPLTTRGVLGWSKRRGVEDEGLELPALPPRVARGGRPEPPRLARLRGLLDEGDAERLRLEAREVKVRDVVQDGLRGRGPHGEGMGGVPASLDREARRVRGVLSAGEQDRDAHGRGGGGGGGKG